MINFFDTNNLKIESKPCSLQPEDYDGAGHQSFDETNSNNN